MKKANNIKNLKRTKILLTVLDCNFLLRIVAQTKELGIRPLVVKLLLLMSFFSFKMLLIEICELKRYYDKRNFLFYRISKLTFIDCNLT